MNERDFQDMQREREKAEGRVSARAGFKEPVDRREHAVAFAKAYANGSDRLEAVEMAAFDRHARSISHEYYETSIARVLGQTDFERQASARMLGAQLPADPDRDRERGRQVREDADRRERQAREDGDRRDAQARTDRDREARQREEDRAREDRRREDDRREDARRRDREEEERRTPLAGKDLPVGRGKSVEYGVERDDITREPDRARRLGEGERSGGDEAAFKRVINAERHCIEYWRGGKIALMERGGEILNCEEKPSREAAVLQAAILKERGVKEVLVQGPEHYKEAQSFALAREGIRVSNPELQGRWQVTRDLLGQRERMERGERRMGDHDSVQGVNRELHGLKNLPWYAERDESVRERRGQESLAIANARIAMLQARGGVDMNGRPITPGWAALSPESRERLRHQSRSPEAERAVQERPRDPARDELSERLGNLLQRHKEKMGERGKEREDGRGSDGADTSRRRESGGGERAATVIKGREDRDNPFPGRESGARVNTVNTVPVPGSDSSHEGLARIIQRHREKLELARESRSAKERQGPALLERGGRE